MVIFIYVLELVQLVLATHDAFRIYATGWGRTQVLDDTGLIWLTIPILDGSSKLVSLDGQILAEVSFHQSAHSRRSFMLGEYES